VCWGIATAAVTSSPKRRVFRAGWQLVRPYNRNALATPGSGSRAWRRSYSSTSTTVTKAPAATANRWREASSANGEIDVVRFNKRWAEGNEQALRWFDIYVKKLDDSKPSTVSFYVTGSERWIEDADPMGSDSVSRDWYLAAAGLLTGSD
jgi:hypothetical protein